MSSQRGLDRTGPHHRPVRALAPWCPKSPQEPGAGSLSKLVQNSPLPPSALAAGSDRLAGPGWDPLSDSQSFPALSHSIPRVLDFTMEN